jgi:hypothetical protein
MSTRTPDKLTKRQLDALEKLAIEPASAYSVKTTMNTIRALSRLGMIVAIGMGHMAFPRNAGWKITNAGIAALPPPEDRP